VKARPQLAVGRLQPVLSPGLLLGQRPVLLKGLGETPSELPGAGRHAITVVAHPPILSGLPDATVTVLSTSVTV
jgi:hypothetical protein